MKKPSSRRVQLKGTSPSARLARGASTRIARRTDPWHLGVVLLLLASLGLGFAAGWSVGGTLPPAAPVHATRT